MFSRAATSSRRLVGKYLSTDSILLKVKCIHYIFYCDCIASQIKYVRNAGHEAYTPKAPAGEIYVPPTFTSLEWLVPSPPTAHSFEEPPVSWLYFFISMLCCECY